MVGTHESPGVLRGVLDIDDNEIEGFELELTENIMSRSLNSAIPRDYVYRECIGVDRFEILYTKMTQRNVRAMRDFRENDRIDIGTF